MVGVIKKPVVNNVKTIVDKPVVVSVSSVINKPVVRCDE